MAATVTWNGTTGPTSNGVVNTADSTTGWGVIKITAGGATPSIGVADGAIEGTGAVTITSNNKRVALYADIGAGNTLDFTGGGNAFGQMVYIWGNFLAAGLLQTKNTGGFGVFLESSTPSATQYHLWYFYGKDNYSGGWKRFVLDPTETVSASSGTAINLAAVRYFGLFADTTATARFDNLVVDQIRVGTGITVTGTSTSDALVADLLANETTNRHGIIQSLNDSQTAVELNGKLILGDTTAATDSTLSDINSKIFVAEPRYYDGTSFTNSVPLDYFDINCVGGTGTNSIIIGKPVGSDSGRNGWSVVGNSTYHVNISFDNGSVNTSEWYACSFESLSGSLTWGTNTAHNLFSSSFSGCEQFDPVGGVQIRNCNFTTVYDDGTADASNRSALLWNSSINIQKCNFLANSHASSDVAHGIEHDTIPGVATGTVTTPDATGVTLTDSSASFLTTAAVNDIAYNEIDGSYATVTSITDNNNLVCAAGLANGSDNRWDSSDAYSVTTPITYTDLNFNGNEKDVHNSTSPQDALVISKSGTSNPSTNTGIVVFQGSVPITITVNDTATDPIELAQTAVFLTSDDSEILNTDTNASGVASGSFAGATPADCYVRVRKSSTGYTRYVPLSTTATIASSTGLDLQVTLRIDSNT